MSNYNLTKVSTCRRVKTTIRKNIYNEYVVRIHVDGKWLGEDTNYYTDDKNDAILSANDMRQREAARINK